MVTRDTEIPLGRSQGNAALYYLLTMEQYIMTISTNTNALVKAISSIDRASGTALRAAREAASLLVADHDPRAPFEDERKRLMAFARSTVADAKIKLKHERNVWQFIGQQLLIQMAPDVVVEIKPPSGKNGAVTKVAEDCSTAREVATAAKQIREVHGSSDGRSKNGPAKTSEHDKLAKQVAELAGFDPEFVKLLNTHLKAVGLNVTKVHATRVRKSAKQAQREAA